MRIGLTEMCVPVTPLPPLPLSLSPPPSPLEKLYGDLAALKRTAAIVQASGVDV